MPTSSLNVHALASDDDGTAAVLVHVVVNTFSVIGSASQTLLERWEQLPEPGREQLLTLIHDSVREGIDRLQFLYHALVPAMLPAPSDMIAAHVGG